MARGRKPVWLLLLLLLAVTHIGCTRTRYRLRADRDSYRILGEHTDKSPWQLPGFTIAMDPRSRLFDRSPPDAPRLPPPAPQLYAYQLPEIATRDPSRFKTPGAEAIESSDVSAQSAQASSNVMQVSYRFARLPSAPHGADQVELAYFTPVPSESPVRVAGQEPRPGTIAEELPPPIETPQSKDVDDGELGNLGLVPLKEQVWGTIPDKCLRRMFEFQSIRSEYSRTFDQAPSDEQRDAAPRAALEDLLELAILNSREYQTQKEQLYQAALRVSFERYVYQLKFLPVGNGLDVDWRHRRDAGVTENSLALPSSVGLDKVLATGGGFLTRFANDVLLTFNGADGFSADVGSEIFAELSQRLLQRDIFFEPLTTAERNLVYAARDYARFRKTFFRDISGSYYQLLLTYRSIEIDTLDYFSNQRGFDQARAEERAGSLPRFQVDQFEQNALASRSRLIRSCNSLEQGLDQLKLDLGIPPETPLNLDLQELEQITLGDQIAVTRELVRRAQRTVSIELEEGIPDLNLLVSSATNLSRRILVLLELQSQLGGDVVEQSAVQSLLNDLRVQEALLVVERNRQYLANESAADRPIPLNIFQRRIDLIRALLDLQRRRLAVDQQRFDALFAEFERLRAGLDTIQKDLDRIPQLVQQSAELLQRTTAAIGDDALVIRETQVQALVDDAMDRARGILAGLGTGLNEIEIPVDDAMVTALVTRFDLMNQRGLTADDWRLVKLAADDLRSMLNLRASQSIRTRRDVNRPFDFTWDESETQAELSFDAPLNRRSERNRYRATLINYQQALRNLMQAEDEIKFAVRNNLRDLELDRDQYVIAVASAALANERVDSTRLQLQLGLGNITARDFLESQRAFTASLSTVASERIGYILDRIELFLNLELLEVDESGFWPQLYDESHQPSARYQPPPCSGPAYGRLPSNVHYSDWVRGLENIPFGNATVFEPNAREAASAPRAEDEPLPEAAR